MKQYKTIGFLNESTAKFELDMCNLFDKTTPDRAEILYVHEKEVPKSKYPYSKVILCPMTDTSHLGDLDDRELIYLDDKDYLKNCVTSSAEWVVQQIYNLLKKNREDLNGKGVLLIGGMGRIGGQVAEYLPKGRCRVFAYDLDNSKQYIATAVKMADVIVNCISSGPENNNFLNKRIFNLVKQNTIFINVARGHTVNIKDLLAAYHKGNIKGFALDCVDGYTPEQIKELEELSSSYLNNVIVTPHIAGKGKLSRYNTDKYLYQQVIERF